MANVEVSTQGPKGDKLWVNNFFFSFNGSNFTIQEDNKAPDHLLTRQRLNE